jgi:DNA-binding PucR family transcriptional regulator
LLRSAATALARAIGGRLAPLAVVRHGRIDLVARAARRGVDGVQHRLERTQRRLEDGGLSLAIGVSTVVTGLDQVADAYREAELARESLQAMPGVVVLSGMTAFDYLTLRRDPTASRLIREPIQAFVDDDRRQGGVLIATLSEYLACDLNARRAAERLHIHVNTAHYRLGRIAERTGCDLHRFADLVEILIAARFVPTRGSSHLAGDG